MKHTLDIGKLYIISGLPGAGKSSLLKNIPADMILSADVIRERMYGVKTEIKEGKLREYLYGWDMNPAPIFKNLMDTLQERMREKLVTFVDATNLNDLERKAYVELATKFGVEAEVLIITTPLEQCLLNNENRIRHVAPAQIELMNESFVRNSEYAHRLLSFGDELELSPQYLPEGLYDVVGDVHGLYNELVDLLNKAGYTLNKQGVPVHSEGRKLIFLGDVVDRGADSIKMLQFVELISKHGHYFIPGNHEDKLIKIWDILQTQGTLQPRSRSGAETLHALLKLEPDEQSRLINFVKKQKPFLLYTHDNFKYALVHADVASFDPATTPKSAVFYGDSGHGARDSDADYSAGFEHGFNKFRLLRGHIRNTSEQEYVRSLEFDQAFNGELALLNLNEYSKAISNGISEKRAFKENVIFQECNYDYSIVMRNQFELINELHRLQKEKLVHIVAAPESAMTIYKYDRRVFFDGLWDAHPLLLKARGLILDVAGNIVQHPFDKIFNYGERDTALDLPDSTVVQAIEKLNGFLGCITKHPYKNELLLSTTGSFDSPYVGYIKSFITPKMKGLLLNHFKNNNETLMFEVIHPEDNEHPVQYAEEHQGLWLIGAREKEFDSVLKSESYLDELGTNIGFKRPFHYTTTLGEVRSKAKVDQIEGYIVRLADGSGEPITKLKTVHYLTTKFLGRLSVNNIKFMYNSPDKFKLKLDEEYQDIVDLVVSNITQEQLLSLNNLEKINMVRDIIQNMRTDGEKKAQQSMDCSL